MTFPERTSEGKVALYRVSDGQRFVRWPIDARDMLASGSYTVVPPNAPETDSSSSATASVATAQEPGPQGVRTVTAGQFFAEQRANDVRPDPVPHVAAALAQSAAQSPTGAPLVVAPSDAPAPLSAPVEIPGGRGNSASRRRR